MRGHQRFQLVGCPAPAVAHVGIVERSDGAEATEQLGVAAHPSRGCGRASARGEQQSQRHGPEASALRDERRPTATAQKDNGPERGERSRPLRRLGRRRPRRRGGHQGRRLRPPERARGVPSVNLKDIDMLRNLSGMCHFSSETVDAHSKRRRHCPYDARRRQLASASPRPFRSLCLAGELVA